MSGIRSAGQEERSYQEVSILERIASTQHDDEYVGRVDVGHLLVLDVVLVLLLLLGVVLSFYLTYNLILNI